ADPMDRIGEVVVLPFELAWCAGADAEIACNLNVDFGWCGTGDRQSDAAQAERSTTDRVPVVVVVRNDEAVDQAPANVECVAYRGALREELTPARGADQILSSGNGIARVLRVEVAPVEPVARHVVIHAAHELVLVFVQRAVEGEESVRRRRERNQR